jgi:hypothetical protein
LLDSTLGYVHYYLCSQRKKITVTADMHSTSVNTNLWWLSTSVPYGARQGLTELLHSRSFRAGTDAAGQPWNSLCVVGIQIGSRQGRGTGDQNQFIVNRQSDVSTSDCPCAHCHSVTGRRQACTRQWPYFYGIKLVPNWHRSFSLTIS